MIILSPISKSFSQTDINKKDTIVGLKIPVAKKVIKDLLKGDGLEKENILLNEKILTYADQLEYHKEKVKSQEEIITNLNTIILKKNEQFSLQTNKSEELIKELKKQRTKTFLYKVTTFIALVGCGYLLFR